MNETRYSRDGRTEEDKEFFDKYSPTGESEWSRGSVTPFDNDTVLIEIHYNVGVKKDYSGIGPTNYRRSDDRIHDDASDALYRCPELDASDIEVTVKDGIVTLNGFVETRLDKKVAEMTVEPIPGVIDIDNRLTIQNPKQKGLMMDHSPVP
jgi:hypothetical protein